ncbi:MAG: hypothetical protein NXY59_08705 [Aigarchaeota archaeon]|nr:hypothetical protein [Candidatus Pelearchaeum maunauluense]
MKLRSGVAELTLASLTGSSEFTTEIQPCKGLFLITDYKGLETLGRRSKIRYESYLLGKILDAMARLGYGRGVLVSGFRWIGYRLIFEARRADGSRIAASHVDFPHE